MKKKLNKDSKHLKKISQRTSITFKIEIYKRIHKLQRKTNTKSFSRAVNILLNDELNHDPNINNPVQKILIKLFSDLMTKIGKLNNNISGACNNLNQIAYDLNVKKYKNESINSNQFLLQNGLKLREDIQTLQKDKSGLRQVRKEMNQIWQCLM